MAVPALLHQIVAVPGGYESLKELESLSATYFDQVEVETIMTRRGVLAPGAVIDDFVEANLIRRTGTRLSITTHGIRTCLLVEAINGAELREIYRRLSAYEPGLRAYELIREGMTRQFLESINFRPGFSRLYFCSPWIRLDKQQEDLLRHAVLHADRTGASPELLVVTRPREGRDDLPPTSLKPFRELGATIFLNGRLHTKLYIREPGRGGGYSMAIMGSQNLTKSNYLELGIRINADNEMIDQLIGYFWQICNASVEL